MIIIIIVSQHSCSCLYLKVAIFVTFAVSILCKAVEDALLLSKLQCNSVCVMHTSDIYLLYFP